MKVLITGAGGFLGKNLYQHLVERKDLEVVIFTRANSIDDLPRLLVGVDFVFHLAGVNRPKDPQDFVSGNVDLTTALVSAVEAEMCSRGSRIPIVYSSSIQAAYDNCYGASKLAAESVLRAFATRSCSIVHLFRLPNVFGKWSKPNYNSAVATFCHNIARGLPVRINDPSASITLVYIDDVIARFLQLLDGADVLEDNNGFATVAPCYTYTVGEIVRQIEAFRFTRELLTIERVGTSFIRALYSTYLSYLPPDSFSYNIPMHADSRGVFVEMLKTPDCGQFSYFTALPGVTRGGHYHHSKNEKFLVISGEARFRFRHIQTGESCQLITRGTESQIVETIPGWTHDITNIGDGVLVVMLWANEVFDRSNPDTYFCPL